MKRNKVNFSKRFYLSQPNDDPDPNECTVSGALYLVLRISSIAGVAPLSFRKGSANSWHITVSPALCVYSYLQIIFLNITEMVTLYWDFQVPMKDAVRVNYPIQRLMFVFDVGILMTAASVGIYGAPARMRYLIQLTNRIEQINAQVLHQNKTKSREHKIFAVIITALILTFIGAYTDFYTFLQDAIIFHKDLLVACMYGCIYYNYVLILLLEIQFLFTILSIRTLVRSINTTLEVLLRGMSTKDKNNIPIFTTGTQTVGPRNIYPRVNILVDSIGQTHDFSFKHNKAADSVGDLTRAYAAACDLLRGLDKINGLMILVMLLSDLEHLIISPFYMFTYIVSYKPTKLCSLLIQIFWCILHFANLLLVAEPCHHMYTEMERTKVLVSQLMCAASRSDQLLRELTAFSWQLHLNEVRCAPLGLCTLNRSLITSIISGVTTYLVIIVQFQVGMASTI